MSGVSIVVALLRAHAPVMAILPSSSVYAGPVPQGKPLPAISVTEISSNEQDTVNRDKPKTLVRSRVQVTVLAAGQGGYAKMKELLLAAKLGAGNHTGMVGAHEVNSVRPYGVNPEMPVDDAGIYEQSRDFMVTFLETN
jgi:hypothetical protein